VQLASIWLLAENCSQLKAIHSMRRGAGRGKPDGPKRLPIALGFKCVHCRNEFDSRHAIDCHRRHSGSDGTPCADPRNHKSMSMTERGDQAAGILRQHDTLVVPDDDDDDLGRISEEEDPQPPRSFTPPTPMMKGRVRGLN